MVFGGSFVTYPFVVYVWDFKFLILTNPWFSSATFNFCEYKFLSVDLLNLWSTQLLPTLDSPKFQIEKFQGCLSHLSHLFSVVYLGHLINDYYTSYSYHNFYYSLKKLFLARLEFIVSHTLKCSKKNITTQVHAKCISTTTK